MTASAQGEQLRGGPSSRVHFLFAWLTCPPPPSQIRPRYLSQINSPIVCLMYTGDNCTMTSGYRVKSRINNIGASMQVSVGLHLSFRQPSCSLPLLPPCIVCEFVCSSLLMVWYSSMYLNTPVSVRRGLVLKQGNCPITGWGYVHRLWGVPTVWPVGYTAVTSWLHWGVSHWSIKSSPFKAATPQSLSIFPHQLHHRYFCPCTCLHTYSTVQLKVWFCMTLNTTLYSLPWKGSIETLCEHKIEWQ